jgi:hypothetical protein
MTVQDRPSRTAGPASATGLYCYGVVWAHSVREQAEGVGGARVTSVHAGDLAALTSQVPSTARVKARRRDLLKHLDVLTVALTDGPVLPLRFGTVFEDEEDLVGTLLDGRRDELTRLLREFDGLVELSVKAFFREAEVLAEIVRDSPRIARLRDATSKGSEAGTYALRIELGELVAAELEARADREADRILRRLRPLARRVEVDMERLEHRVLRAAFLVDRERVPEFDAAMDEVARREAGRIDFKYLGPLPPHSFVALEAR